MSARAATRSDLDAVTETIWVAFRDDPLWSWAFADHAALKPLWRLLIGSAFRYGWVWTVGDFAAATVWIPPGGKELTEEEDQRVPALLEGLLGSGAAAVLELLRRFDAAHPTHEPHYYLSFVGTHPEHRGKGLGMSLLAENLAKIDEQAMPAYLESSNPDNDRRYRSLGFVRVGEFSTPDKRRTVSTMWRDAR